MHPTQSLENLPRHGKMKGPAPLDMWGAEREEEKVARTLESQEVPLGAQKFSGASVRRVERDLEGRSPSPGSPRSPRSPEAKGEGQFQTEPVRGSAYGGAGVAAGGPSEKGSGRASPGQQQRGASP